MREGPKKHLNTGPLDLSKLPKAVPERVIAFVEAYVYVTRGVGARKRMQLRPWQREIIHGLFGDPRPRQGLLSLPRGNGKSTLAAAIGLYGLFADREEGASVLLVASDERQAGIIFNIARRMVEPEPKLQQHCQIFQDKIVVPQTDSVLRPLPAEPNALLGWDPSLLIVDELAVVNEKCWEAASLAAGKRAQSLTLAISTPPEDMDSIMFKLLEHGRDGSDASFYFKEFAAPAGCAIDDEDAWHVGNPALGDFLAIDAMRATRKTSRESTFRRQRLGQTVFGSETWITTEQWRAASRPGLSIPDGTQVCLGFDGSYNHDATALVAISTTKPHHLIVVELWEKTADDGSDWRVPIADVEDLIRTTCKRWKVNAVVCDPSWWAPTLQLLLSEGLPMVEFRPSSPLMVSASEALRQTVVDGGLTHSGDQRLARHISNAVLRTTPSGPRVMKESKSSNRHVDLCIASILAFQQASLIQIPEPEIIVPIFVYQ